MFGLAAQNQILELSHAVLTGDIKTALDRLNELSQNGKELGRLLADLLNHFRNLLLFQVSKGDLQMIEATEAEVEMLKKQSALTNTNSLVRILEVLAESETRLRDASSKKILVEVALLKAIEAHNSVSIDTVLKQLNQLRGQGGTALPASAPAVSPAPVKAAAVSEPAPAAPPAAKPAATRAPAPVPAPASGESVDLPSLWTQLVESVGRASPFTRSYLIDARAASFERGVLVISFDPEFEDHLGLVDNARNHTLIQTKLAELGHPNAQIKFVKAAEAPGGAPRPSPAAATAAPAPAAKPVAAPPTPAATAKPVPPPVPFNKSDFKNDPLIQKALEIFKGQIVEVRA